MRPIAVAILAGASLVWGGCGVGVDDPEGWEAAHPEAAASEAPVLVPVGVAEGGVVLWSLVDPVRPARAEDSKGSATVATPTGNQPTQKQNPSTALPQDPQPWDAPKSHDGVPPPEDDAPPGVYGPGPK